MKKKYWGLMVAGLLGLGIGFNDSVFQVQAKDVTVSHEKDDSHGKIDFEDYTLYSPGETTVGSDGTVKSLAANRSILLYEDGKVPMGNYGTISLRVKPDSGLKYGDVLRIDLLSQDDVLKDDSTGKKTVLPYRGGNDFIKGFSQKVTGLTSSMYMTGRGFALPINDKDFDPHKEYLIKLRLNIYDFLRGESSLVSNGQWYSLGTNFVRHLSEIRVHVGTKIYPISIDGYSTSASFSPNIRPATPNYTADLWGGAYSPFEGHWGHQYFKFGGRADSTDPASILKQSKEYPNEDYILGYEVQNQGAPFSEAEMFTGDRPFNLKADARMEVADYGFASNMTWTNWWGGLALGPHTRGGYTLQIPRDKTVDVSGLNGKSLSDAIKWGKSHLKSNTYTTVHYGNKYLMIMNMGNMQKHYQDMSAPWYFTKTQLDNLLAWQNYHFNSQQMDTLRSKFKKTTYQGQTMYMWPSSGRFEMDYSNQGEKLQTSDPAIGMNLITSIETSAGKKWSTHVDHPIGSKNTVKGMSSFNVQYLDLENKQLMGTKSYYGYVDGIDLNGHKGTKTADDSNGDGKSEIANYAKAGYQMVATKDLTNTDKSLMAKYGTPASAGQAVKYLDGKTPTYIVGLKPKTQRIKVNYVDQDSKQTLSTKYLSGLTLKSGVYKYELPNGYRYAGVQTVKGKDVFTGMTNFSANYSYDDVDDPSSNNPSQEVNIQVKKKQVVIPKPSLSLGQEDVTGNKRPSWVETFDQQVGTLGETVYEPYTHFELNETFDDRVEVKASDVKVYDDSKQDITNQGSVSVSGNKVTWIMNDAYRKKLPLNGEHYVMKSKVSLKQAQLSGKLVHQGYSVINAINSLSKLVSSGTVPEQKENLTDLDLMVDPIENKQINPNKDTNLSYQSTVVIGNNELLRSLEFKDQLPAEFDGLKSFKVEELGSPYVPQVQDLTSNFTNKGTGNQVDLVPNSNLKLADLVGAKLRVTLNTKTKAYTSWNKYYASKTDQISVPNTFMAVVNNRSLSVKKATEVKHQVDSFQTTMSQDGQTVTADDQHKAQTLNLKWDRPVDYEVKLTLDNAHTIDDLGLAWTDRSANKSLVAVTTASGKDVTTKFALQGTSVVLKDHSALAELSNTTLDFKLRSQFNSPKALTDVIDKPDGQLLTSEISPQGTVKNVKTSIPMSFNNIYWVHALGSKFFTGDKINGEVVLGVKGLYVEDSKTAPKTITGANKVWLSNLGSKQVELPSAPLNQTKVVRVPIKDLEASGTDNFKVKSDSYQQVTAKDNVKHDQPLILVNFGHDTQTYAAKYQKPSKDEISANKATDVPAVTLNYYADEGKQLYERVLKEHVEFKQPETMSAKAGYGIKASTRLESIGWERKLSTNETTLAFNDPAKILATKNSEIAVASRTHEVLDGTVDKDYKPSDKTLKSLDSLNDATKDVQTKITALEKQLKLMPKVETLAVDYQFNHRDLRNGKQSFTEAKNSHPTDNLNSSVDYTTKVSDGGNRYYLDNFLENGDYTLNYKMQDVVGANQLKVDFNRKLNVYGHRYLAKSDGYNTGEDEIGLQPTISGDNQQDLAGFTAKDKQWLKDNNVKGVKP